MRLRRLNLKGFTRFDQVEVDFAGLGPGLVAIAGATGAGKTTLLEAMFAALYGFFPTRAQASLYGSDGIAHGRDAKIEVEFEDGGQSYRALLAVDAVGQRSEMYLFNGNGSPIVGPKVREYLAEIERRFGSGRMFLASVMSSQTKAGSFAEASKSQRKDLVGESLDTAGLQRLSEAARAEAKAGELALALLRGQLAETEAELKRLAGAEPTEDLAGERARLEAAIATGQADLEAARTRYADLQTRHALAVEAAKQRAIKEGEWKAARAQEATVHTRLEAIPAERKSATARAEAAIAAAQEDVARLPEYQQAETALQLAKVDRRGRANAVTEAEHALRTARETLLARTKETGKAAGIKAKLAGAQRQAGLLGEVPCTITSEWEIAGTVAVAVTDLAGACPLLADAREAKATIAALEGDLADVEKLEAGLPAYQQAVDQAEKAVSEARAALADVDAEIGRLTALAAALPGAQAAQRRAVEVRQQLEETLASLTAREAEYREQLTALSAKCETLAAEFATYDPAGPGALGEEMRAAAAEGNRLKGAVDEFRAEHQKLVQAIARAEAEAQRRTELEERAAQAREQVATLEADQGDWVTLERALGRDGIQALELDTAGPELSSIATDLLRCYGDRFEIDFVTQKARADGKGMKEDYDISISDRERGRVGTFDTYSGGEKALLAEAVAGALALYNGRHSKHRFGTLWRDETASSLDDDSAIRYITMLRRIKELGGFEQVIFIAHQQQTWALADAVLYLQDGQIEVRA